MTVSCPACGGTQLVQVGRVAFELKLNDPNVPWAEPGARSSRDTQFHGALVVCGSCGRTELYMEDPAGWVQHARAHGAVGRPVAPR